MGLKLMLVSKRGHAWKFGLESQQFNERSQQNNTETVMICMLLALIKKYRHCDQSFVIVAPQMPFLYLLLQAVTKIAHFAVEVLLVIS